MQRQRLIDLAACTGSGSPTTLDWRLRPYIARPLHRQLDRVFRGAEAEAIGALAAFVVELEEQVNSMVRTLTAGAEFGS
ncbi:hypothetical protein COUCH_26200 [Couchioplanes caeruleus]|uniref:hypothetical protein n=1 Tax=Couchioplanes caeruleus TaxID=56438 RepID=UPI0020BF68EB|nr:hypothetical protein [Couchioplanes caeruleus]UQU62513.1 hypothetical protein COUCH_26200 [Couchioplanes caeruleus]